MSRDFVSLLLVSHRLTGITDVCSHIQLYVAPRDPNSGPHVCEASVLPVSHLLLRQCIIFILVFLVHWSMLPKVPHFNGVVYKWLSLAPFFWRRVHPEP